MLPFAITHAGVYRMHQPDFRQVIHCPWISLCVRGFRFLRHEDGSLAMEDPGPHLYLGVPGTALRFGTGPERENYVIMLDGLDLRAAGSAGCAELRLGSGWTQVPLVVPLESGTLPSMQLEFQHVVDCLANPLPQRLLSAHLAVAGLLRAFVDRAGASRPGSPAEALRAELDRDAGFHTPLPELARRCGYGPDHLRALFRRAYGVSPREYRDRLRLAAVMDLLARSRLSVKEIAARTGFVHLSHLSAFVRARTGLCPREALARYRHGEG